MSATLQRDYLPMGVYRPTLFEAESAHAGLQFYVSIYTLREIEEKGPAWKFYDSRLCSRVLKEPEFVFGGVREQFHDGSFCYVGKPERRYTNDNQLEASPEGEVFLVFARREFGLIVFDWEWRLESECSGRPENWEQDFKGGVLWKRH